MTSRLASLLVQDGLIAPKRMAEAFQRQVIYGGTLDTILLEMDVLDESTLLDALGRASSLPTAGDLPSVDQLKAAGAAAWFPLELSERYHAVPVALDGSVVRVLVIDPPDRKQLDELGYTLSRSLDPIIVPEHRFVHATAIVYDVAIPARYQSLQAKLLKRALTRPAPVVVAAAVPDQSSPSSRPATGVSDSPVPAAVPVPAPAAALAPVPEDLRVPRTSLPGRARPESTVSDPPTRRAFVTDVPMPPPRSAAAPAAPMIETPTPRLIVSPVASVRGPEVAPLSLEAATSQIAEAIDRDVIFTAMCRGARARVPFAAVLTVHGEVAGGKMALSERWLEREVLANLSVAIDRSPPFRAAVNGRGPFIGRVGDEATSAQALTSLGRKPPVPAVLLPIVLRERTVALLYADASGAPIAAELLSELNGIVTAAAGAFQRLILRAKGVDYAAAKPAAFRESAGKLRSRPASSGPPDESAGAWRAPSPDSGRASQRHSPAALMRAVQDSLPPTAPEPAPAAVTSRESLAKAPTPAAKAGLPPEGIEALLTSVMRGDDQARHSAETLLSLGERGAEAVVARMPGPLRLDRHTLRGTVPPLSEHGPLLTVLARFGQRAREALLRRVSDGLLEIRYYATLALGELGGPAAVVALGSRLFDSDAGVRAVAIDALAHLPESNERRSLIESLRGELPGPDVLRQRLAAETLGGMHDVTSIPRLIELVKHDDAAVVASARRALVVITKQDFGASRWRWRGWWERHRDQPRLEWIFEGLAHTEAEVRLSASEELKQLAPESFGYHFDLPKRERDDARKRWVEWWRTHGKKYLSP